jgi:hypothetical protein
MGSITGLDVVKKTESLPMQGIKSDFKVVYPEA